MPSILSLPTRSAVAPSTATARTTVRIPMAAVFWRCRPALGHALTRAIEIAVAGGALLVLSPLLAVVALLIKATDGGPILFWQTRVGRHGAEFAFPKFRSMVVDAEKRKDQLLSANQHGGAGVTFKMKRDPRITWIGRFIRRWSIDELPQLWSVVTGSMALVGPRPAVPREVSQYSVADRRRLAGRPGITCTWQVSGRAEIPFPKQVEMDHEYITQRNLRRDVSLMFRTVPAVLGGRGAY